MTYGDTSAENIQMRFTWLISSMSVSFFQSSLNCFSGTAQRLRPGIRNTELSKGPSKLLRAVRNLRRLVKENPEIETEIKYLQVNRTRMNYFELLQKELPIGSGVVEAACKDLIGARMKKFGMR